MYVKIGIIIIKTSYALVNHYSIDRNSLIGYNIYHTVLSYNFTVQLAMLNIMIALFHSDKMKRTLFKTFSF